MIEVLSGKIHNAIVTGAQLNYVGSITIDNNLIKAAGMFVGQKVLIVNNNNGERLETYIIKGEEGTGVVCLNGAAARKVQKGDEIIIITFETIEKHKISFHKPTVIFPHNDNLLFQTNEDIVRELYEENILTVSQIAMKMGRTIEEVNEILKD